MHKTAEDAAATLLNVETLDWFKSYVAGGNTGLQVAAIHGYDIDGNDIQGLSATSQ